MKTHSISKLGIAITLVALLHAPSLAKDNDEWKESGTPDFEW